MFLVTNENMGLCLYIYFSAIKTMNPLKMISYRMRTWTAFLKTPKPMGTGAETGLGWCQGESKHQT